MTTYVVQSSMKKHEVKTTIHVVSLSIVDLWLQVNKTGSDVKQKLNKS